MRQRLPLVGLLAALVLVAGVAGCASSNLDERPEWAKSYALPPTHPLAAQYPAGRYLPKVVIGTGASLEAAKQSAYENALSAYSEAIMAEVTSRYISDTREAYSTGGADELQKKVSSFIAISAKQTLTGVEEILAWDGYEREKKYYFACYVLDMKKAGDLVFRMAQEQYAELTEIQRRLEGGVRAIGQDELERLSLDALRALFRYKVLSLACVFFSRSTAALPDTKTLEHDCIQTVYQAGQRREASGSERDLEEALKFYQEATQYRPDKILMGRILAVKRRLPCVECGRAGKCIECGGQGGRWVTCEHCKGSMQVNVTCPVCKGDGKATCPSCNGVKTVQVTCPRCDGQRRITCPTCKGEGRVIINCRACGGGGAVACSSCRGRGVVHDGAGNAYPCQTCGGQGSFPCQTCGGSGKEEVVCSASTAGPRGEALAVAIAALLQVDEPSRFCNGEGVVPCPDCKGTGRVAETCPQCQGTGRLGVCHRCGGAGQVVTKCLECKNGYQWQRCGHCDGRGACPVCGGRGHRP